MFWQVFEAVIRIALVAMPAWLAIRLGLRLLSARRMPSLGRETLLLAAVLYGAALAAVTVYPLPVARQTATNPPRINTAPFARTMRCFVPRPGFASQTSRFCVQNVAGNIMLFVPLGILLSVLPRPQLSMPTILAIALCASLAIEAAQFAERFVGLARSVDVDDVIFNVAGAVIGAVAATAGRRLRSVE